MTRALLVLMAACAGATTPDIVENTEDTAAATMPWLTDTEAEPAWTAAQAVEAIETAFAGGLPDSQLPVDTYLALMAQGEGDCPGNDTQLTDAVIHGCETAAGVWFEGVSEYAKKGVQGTEGSYVEYVTGDFLIIDADGVLLEVGGHSAVTEIHSGESVFREMELHGSWVWTPSESFLDVENSLSLGLTLHFDGAFSMHGSWGRGDQYLYFDALTFDWVCEGHPVGAVWVRGPEGFWYTLTLSDACEGCGPVGWSGGIELGDACVDLRPAALDLAARMVEAG